MKVVASMLLAMVAAVVAADARAQVIYEPPDPDIRWDGTDYTVELDDPFAFYNEDARRTDKMPRIVGYPIPVVRDPRPYAGGVSYRRPDLFMIPRAPADEREASFFRMRDLPQHRMMEAKKRALKVEAEKFVKAQPAVVPIALNVPNPAAKGQVLIRPSQPKHASAIRLARWE